MSKRLIRAHDGTVVPYGLICDHLSYEAGLGYYAVFQPGEEQFDYYCEHCYESVQLGKQVPLDRCCIYCANEMLERHFLIKEVQIS